MAVMCCRADRERSLLTLDEKLANVRFEIRALSSMPKRRYSGTGRERSPSPKGSSRRNSRGDGKGGVDGGAREGTPKISGKSPSGRLNRPPCTNFKGNARQEIRAIMCMSLNVQS